MWDKKVAACRRAAQIVKERLEVRNTQKIALNSQEQTRFLVGKYFLARKVRSTIGLPKKMKDLMLGLGFRDTWSSVCLPVTKESVGALAKARHLVELKLVDDIPVTRKPKELDFEVVGNWMDDKGNGKLARLVGKSSF